MTLETGYYTYCFCKLLPPRLPSSFEGKYGYVRYTLVANLHTLRHSHPISAVYFTVKSQLDLNKIPAIREPAHLSKDKYLFCLCCKTGPITVAVSLPVKGYVPKQYIPVSVEVDNSTSLTLPAVCFLKKEVVFTADHPRRRTRSTREVVAQLGLGVAGPHISCTWEEKLAVPSLPPSILESCDIIRSNYSVLVQIRIPGFHRNIKMSVPITIGTIPLT